MGLSHTQGHNVKRMLEAVHPRALDNFFEKVRKISALASITEDRSTQRTQLTSEGGKMTRPKEVHPWQLHVLARRTNQRKYFLRPGKDTRELFGYMFVKA